MMATGHRADPASTASSDEGARRKNLFSKDERLHLLSIMIQYAPLLDDKSASVFDRREIWRAIERDFHQAGFTGKTSAQLKKYWQNYKYHGRRAQAGVRKHPTSTPREEMHAEPLHPEVPESGGNPAATRIAKESAAPRVSPHRDVLLQSVAVESGCRQRQMYRDNGTFFRKLSAAPILPTDLDSMGKSRFDSETSQRKRSSAKIYEEPKSSAVIDRKPEKPIGSDVIVSTTDVSNNSVTVSVIYPERTGEPPLSRSQPKRKREGDASLDRLPFQSSAVPAAASPGKKQHRDDDHSIFTGVTSAMKGRCFLLQPRQADNRGEVISEREGAAEGRRKLESARKESFVSASKFVSWSEISCSARRIESDEDIPREDFVAAPPPPFPPPPPPPPPPAPAYGLQDVRNSATQWRSGKSQEESRTREEFAANSRDQQRDESNREATEPRTPLGNARLWGRDMAGPVQSELRNYELSHRLMLHRLETEEKRLKVKIAEMAIQEIRFRIRALNEDIRRADELHELHLALATAQAQNAQGLRV